MAITKARLYSPDGTAQVRQGVTVADAGTWTPDDISNDAQREAAILDAREWDSVRVFVDGTDGAGAAAAITSITVVPLLAVSDDRSGATRGRAWLELAATAALGPGDSAEVAVDGHACSFRVTAIALGAATDGRVRVTGGVRRRSAQY